MNTFKNTGHKLQSSEAVAAAFEATKPKTILQQLISKQGKEQRDSFYYLLHSAQESLSNILIYIILYTIQIS